MLFRPAISSVMSRLRPGLGFARGQSLLRAASLRYAVGAWLALLHPATWASDWQMDAQASRLEFVAQVQHQPAPGHFNSFDTRLHLDGKDSTNNSLEVRIEMSSAEMASGEMTEAIGTEVWFDVAHHPTAEYHSLKIERIDAEHFIAHGELDLKGQRQAVDVPFTWQATDSMATMHGEITLARRRFKIGTGDFDTSDTVDDEVVVRFTVVLHGTG